MALTTAADPRISTKRKRINWCDFHHSSTCFFIDSSDVPLQIDGSPDYRASKYVNKWLSASPFHSLSRRDLLFVVLSHQTNARYDFYYQLPRIRDKARRLVKKRKIDNQTGCCETIYLGWHRCLDSNLTSAFVDTCRRYYSLFRVFAPVI